jgi:hypothetical protein
LPRYSAPDCVFSHEPEFDIPMLDPLGQADAVDLPVAAWGSQGRTRRMTGTWSFYVDDKRFEGLWAAPEPVPNSGCLNVCEVNFSIFDQTPIPVALWHIYKKRWLARYWQSHGVRIFVDLNVSERYAEMNLLGVPAGWRAYATRGYTERLDATERELELARKRAGSRDILFVVCGGGRHVAEWCADHGAIHVVEHMTAVRCNRQEARRNGKG